MSTDEVSRGPILALAYLVKSTLKFRGASAEAQLLSIAKDVAIALLPTANDPWTVVHHRQVSSTHNAFIGVNSILRGGLCCEVKT